MGLNNFLKTALYAIFFCFLSCAEKNKEINLHFDDVGNISMEGNSKFVKNLGAMNSVALENLPEPERGVTRLIIKNMKNVSIPNNVFDIYFTGMVDVKGDGTYHLNRQTNSNIWYLEIHGDDVKELSIIEGEHGTSTNYNLLGWILIIFGVILFIIGIFTIVVGGIGCLLKIIAVILIIIGILLINNPS
ncbi:hypothetical protein GCM10011514_01610 [Emticicia aquatilis]|uniref:Uncharacterized protein n=1 Tax=Emticicia aquatilis TaxID=1537369 RepID=A0A916YDM1_9BACT|nr:hypothetical protein [Emticicia aquatilis]GGD41249.1 hypothetical protein GCM10011514_01610 [Emticicia aquatilis]